MKKNFLRVIDNPYLIMVGWFLFLIIPGLSFLKFILIKSNFQALSIVKPYISDLFTIIKYFSYIFNILIITFLFRKQKLSVLSKKDTVSLLSCLVLSLTFIIISLSLITLENYKYPNFLYSKLGITPTLLTYYNYTLLLFSLSIAYLLVEKKSFISKFTSLNTIIKNYIKYKNKIFIFLISLFILPTVLSSIVFIHDIPVIIKSTTLNNRARFGEEFDYIDSILDITPENSVVVHPPQSGQWPFIGNQPMIRYFLFPRTLVSGAIISQEVANKFQTLYFPFLQMNNTQWPIIDNSHSTVYFDTDHPIVYKEIIPHKDSKEKIVYEVQF